MKRGWTERDMPDLAGRVAVVTGANGGLGFESARALAAAGATVILACRSVDKGRRAWHDILARHPSASLELVHLDLGDLASVRAFAEGFEHDRLDILLNNAGVMGIPRRETTDGFEVQLGTNHLGHFALTGLLLDRLLASPEARVVTVSSLVHRAGRMRFDDLHGQRSYDPWRAYAQSKLANLLFTFELQHRLERLGATTCSVAAHPGYASTNLQRVAPAMRGSTAMGAVTQFSNLLFAQSATAGARPQLYAAAGPDVEGGDFFGPARLELWGSPERVTTSTAARDIDAARRLWEVSIEATDVAFEALERSSSVLR